MKISLSNRTMGIIMALILLLVVIHVSVQTYFTQKIISDLVAEKQTELSRVYNHALTSLYEKYLLIGNNLLTNPLVRDAIKSGDRAKLMALTMPVYEQLRSENPFLDIMHFHTADTVSLLRLHRPANYGDDLSSIRHIIHTVNRDHTPLFAPEVGKYAISYRIAIPLILDGGDYGVLEFGIDIRYFNALLGQQIGVPTVFALRNDAITPYLRHMHPEKPLPEAPYTLFGIHEYDTTWKGMLPPLEELTNAYYIRPENGDRFFCRGSELLDFQGKEIGHLYMQIDLGFLTQRMEHYRQIVIALTGLLMLLSFILLRRAFSSYHREIERHETKLVAQNRILEEMATVDPLTKIYNRRKTSDILAHEYDRYLRYGSELSIIMFDIDDFKAVNDRYGHNIGDDILKAITKLVLSSIRKTDYFGRWGGEEFLIVSLETNLHTAASLAEKLREAIDRHPFDINGIRHISCSFGVAQFTHPHNVRESIHLADSAMYLAKRSGKNCVKTADDLSFLSGT